MAKKPKRAKLSAKHKKVIEKALRELNTAYSHAASGYDLTREGFPLAPHLFAVFGATIDLVDAYAFYPKKKGEKRERRLPTKIARRLLLVVATALGSALQSKMGGDAFIALVGQLMQETD